MKVRQSVKAVAILCCLILAGLVFGCRQNSLYIHEVEQWHADRMKGIHGARGWLSLAGLYPIPPGKSSFGSGDTMKIRFPHPAPDQIGTIDLDSAKLSIQVVPGVAVQMEDGTVFPGGTIDMEQSPLLHLNALYWTFIERAGKYYVRLWDTLSTRRQELQEIACYPINGTGRYQ